MSKRKGEFMKLLKSLLAAALTVTVAACSSTGSSASSASSIKEEVKELLDANLTECSVERSQSPKMPLI